MTWSSFRSPSGGTNKIMTGGAGGGRKLKIKK